MFSVGCFLLKSSWSWRVRECSMACERSHWKEGTIWMLAPTPFEQQLFLSRKYQYNSFYKYRAASGRRPLMDESFLHMRS